MEGMLIRIIKVREAVGMRYFWMIIDMEVRMTLGIFDGMWNNDLFNLYLFKILS